MQISEKIYYFGRNIAKSLYPHSYRELKENSIWSAISFMLIMILVSLLLVGILFLPKAIGAKDYIDKQLSALDTFDIGWSLKMNDSIEIPEKNPYLIISTAGHITNITGSNILITETKVYYKSAFGKVKQINLTDYKNVASKKEELASLFSKIIWILIPSLFLLFFVIFSVKYLLVIAVSWALALGITKLLKFHLKIREAFVVALYSSTIMIVTDTLTIPLGLKVAMIPFPLFAGANLGLIPLVLYLIVFTISIIIVGSRLHIR